jgi:hypothetical protein
MIFHIKSSQIHKERHGPRALISLTHVKNKSSRPSFLIQYNIKLITKNCKINIFENYKK